MQFDYEESEFVVGFFKIGNIFLNIYDNGNGHIKVIVKDNVQWGYGYGNEIESTSFNWIKWPEILH